MSDHAPSSPYGSWQRWQMQAFEVPDVAHQTSHAHADQKPTLPKTSELMAEIERLRQAAVQRGHAEGYQSGHTQGEQAGYQAGFDQGQRQGYEEGLAQGKNQGFTEGQTLAHEQAQQLSTLLHSTQEQLDHLHRSMGEALLNTAIRIASHVVQHTVQHQPEALLAIVRTVLEPSHTDYGCITFSVHSRDYALVESYLREHANSGTWQIKVDDSIQAGGCYVRTALGDIDATLESRWHRAIQSLTPRSSATALQELP